MLYVPNFTQGGGVGAMRTEKITLKIDEIKPYGKNPRKNDKAVKDVQQSIIECGYNDLIEVDEDNVILSGHTRRKALEVLGYKQAECIRISGMTDEQKRKYRILANKTGEKAKWDEELLKGEMFDLDFSAFSFDFDKVYEDKPEDYKQTKSYDNLFMSGDVEQGNDWGIPVLKPVTVDTSGAEWVSFGEKASIKDPANTILQMYVDDYKFESVWTTPKKWLELFQSCRAVVAPDFSCYTDMPKAQQLWNHYRRQWCAKFWQDNGVMVIASISFPIGDVRVWHTEGIPEGTACATSFVGDALDKEQNLTDTINLVEKLKPSQLFIKANSTDEAMLRKHFEFELIPAYAFKGGKESGEGE